MRGHLGRKLWLGVAATSVAITCACPAWAQGEADQSAKAEESEAAPLPGEIVVTARRFSERLQDVPDAVTAFSTESIERAGIQSFGDFANMTPNLSFADGASYSAGSSTISMRGIGNGQLGWPSVSILVDGVPVDSLDALADGTLTDVAQIEVLRGPQSALYGFNAIAGAVNIRTKAPTNAFGAIVQGEYGSGDNRSLLTAVSGPLAHDVLAFRVTGYLRKRDGLITDPVDGDHLDPIDQKMVKAQLRFTPGDAVEFNLSGSYNDNTTGSTFQRKFRDLSQVDDFSGEFDPRRRLIGRQDHKVWNIALRGQIDLGFAELATASSYSHTNQTIVSSLCYDDPDNPIVPANPPFPGKISPSCLVPLPVYGSAAAAGEGVDILFDARDRYRTFYQDVRLQSNDGALRWLVGVNYLNRRAFNGFDIGLITAPAAGGTGCADGFGFYPSKCGPIVQVFGQWFARRDRWWGAYAQLAYDVTDQIELTGALRYDQQKYDTTQYVDAMRSAVVATIDADGNPVDILRERGRKLQPKLQISYKFDPSTMAYFTYSRGWRAGFFNTGQFTRPEDTVNFELGAKSAFDLGGTRAILNAAIFKIDYSDQQFSTAITVPPYRVAITIPETRIYGAEVEASIYPARSLSLSASAGYLSAKVRNDGGRSPFAPRWTAMASVDWARKISTDLKFVAHADYRYTSLIYLGTANTDPNPARHYLNARMGIQYKRWSATAFVKNLTDQRDRTLQTIGAPNGGFASGIDDNPRNFGVQLRAEF